jgi:hypothetical protein
MRSSHVDKGLGYRWFISQYRVSSLRSSHNEMGEIKTTNVIQQRFRYRSFLTGWSDVARLQRLMIVFSTFVVAGFVAARESIPISEQKGR